LARQSSAGKGATAQVYHGRYQVPRRPRSGATRRVLLKSVLAGLVAGLLMLRLLPDGALAARAMATPGDACRVALVVDGDSVMIWCGAKGLERARLTGIYTPAVFGAACVGEWRQGRQAAAALRRLILDANQVRIVKEGRGKSGPAGIKVWVDGAPVARGMISGGHARAADGSQTRGWCP